MRNIDKSTVRKAIQETLANFIITNPDAYDDDDLSYVVAKTYLSVAGYRLFGNEIYLEKELVGELVSAMWDGDDLDLTVTSTSPIDFLELVMTCDDLDIKNK